MKKIYFAGGWFSPAQDEQHTRLYELLAKEKNLQIFNPRTVGEFQVGPSTDHMTNVFVGNTDAIDECHLVVAITDYKDMGTIWECGYAYATKKPIIYYCETLGDKPFNLMLAKTGRVARTELELMQLLTESHSYGFRKVHSFDGNVE